MSMTTGRGWLICLPDPPASTGWRLGAHIIATKLTPQPGVNFREWIAGGYVTWTKGRPELLAEYENVHHQRSANIADI